MNVRRTRRIRFRGFEPPPRLKRLSNLSFTVMWLQETCSTVATGQRSKAC